MTKFTEKRVVDFAWSADGKRLAITRGTSLADIVLIKGVLVAEVNEAPRGAISANMSAL